MKARIINGNEFGGHFTDAWIENNLEIIFAGQLVSEWQLTDVLPNENLRKPILENDVWIESMSIQDIVNEDIQKSKNDEFNLYQKRKNDGESAYLKLSAEFRLAKLSGQITEENHSAIEEILTPVRNEVMFGQWKKGLSILEEIGSSQIGVDLYDRLHLQISAYINENY